MLSELLSAGDFTSYIYRIVIYHMSYLNIKDSTSTFRGRGDFCGGAFKVQGGTY